MPRQTFPDKQEGDRLGASHVNKLNRVARDFTSLFGGSYGLTKEGQQTHVQPFVQIPIEVITLSCDEDDDLVEVRPLYYDFDNNKWKLNDESGPFCLDPTVYGDTSTDPPSSILDLVVGDRLAAFWDPQRNTFLPINATPAGCDTIHFTIVFADCINKTALVHIDFRSKGCSSVPEEIILAEGPHVIVNDSMGCHLDEPDADLEDRKGAATYLTSNATGIDQWEIDDICCDPNICLP